MSSSPPRASKLALGTVQFGLDYGILNTRGKITADEATQIIDRAESAGIDTLDTAHAYGESEEILGRLLGGRRTQFHIVSKLPSCAPGRAADRFEESLARLQTSQLYGYLIHHFTSWRENPRLLSELETLRDGRRVQRIGFSLYSPQELELLIAHNARFDLIQLPFSILDRRFEPHLDGLRQRGVEIHVRSTFLQGLLLAPAAEPPSGFERIRPILMRLDELARIGGLTRGALCLAPALLDPRIDRVVIGVDCLEHLQAALRDAGLAEAARGALSELRRLSIEDEDLLLPTNWRRAESPDS